MSCRNFETTLTELARNQMLDAGARASALEHLDSCERCALRFADERSLTAGLRAAASHVAQIETPARVEASLLSAFREQRAGASSLPAVTRTPRTFPGWAGWAVAAAAALLVVSAMSVTHLLFNDSGEASQKEASIQQPAPVSFPAVSPEESASGETGTPPKIASDNIENEPVVVPSPRRSVNRQRDLVRNVATGNMPVHNANNFAPANASEEVTTEFLPLTYGGLSQVEDGQVVRVEVPRSALQSLGLPFNAERAGERVKADVLIGHDGVARAIRFVK